MPYIRRDNNGAIISLHSAPPEPDSTWLESDHPELLDFLNRKDSSEGAKAALTSTDYELIRVIEDVVDLLVKKQLIIITELPKPVQEKLGARKKLRQDMESLENLINDESDIL